MKQRNPFWLGIILISLLTSAGIQTVSAQSFVQVTNPFPQVNYGAVDWGDFDNDGDLDLLIAGSTSSAALTQIYRNDGNGIFTDIRANLPIAVAFGGAAIWGDFDGDGDLDFFLGGGTEPGRTDIFRNDGGGVFTPMNAGLARAQVGSAAWGDFDNDAIWIFTRVALTRTATGLVVSIAMTARKDSTLWRPRSRRLRTVLFLGVTSISTEIWIC